MKRLALGLIAVLALSACSTNNDFVIENGLCYRIRTETRIGIQTYQQKTAAVPQNCGL